MLPPPFAILNFKKRLFAAQSVAGDKWEKIAWQMMFFCYSCFDNDDDDTSNSDGRQLRQRRRRRRRLPRNVPIQVAISIKICHKNIFPTWRRQLYFEVQNRLLLMQLLFYFSLQLQSKNDTKYTVSPDAGNNFK